jgi:hypothetical protein
MVDQKYGSNIHEHFGEGEGMKLVTIIIKRSRITNHHKFWGGVLNPNKQYYTRKVEAQTIKEIQNACTQTR